MRPDTEDTLAEMIRAANGPLSVRGGNSRGLTPAGEPLDTTGLCGITLYEPGALTLVAGAGTPLSEIDTALAAEGQRLAFEPMDHRPLLGREGSPTIGGVVAANVSGPRRVSVGACRDFLLGVRFVDGSGNIIKNGGRVMKNVTGYDLVKLMAGAHGTLGVLTEVSFKVLPVPETETTLVLHGADATTAIRAMSDALGTPFEVTGAAHLNTGETPETLLRLEGFETSVNYRAAALMDRLQGYGDFSTLDAAASQRAWRAIRDVHAMAGSAGDVWRISCKPSEAAAIAARTGAEQVQYDWGGGLIWAQVPPATDLRARLGDFDGHATLVRGQGQPRFQPEAPGVAALSQGIRQRFDPRGILNTGLMG